MAGLYYKGTNLLAGYQLSIKVARMGFNSYRKTVGSISIYTRIEIKKLLVSNKLANP